MNAKRILLKLRYESPAQPLRKLADRWIRRRSMRRRRARWSGAVASTRVEGLTPDAARRLWPGAADRSWVAEASRRWPELHAAASRRAEAAAAGRFDLLGSGEVSGLDAAGRIRWHEDFKSGAAWPAERLYLDVPITLPIEGSDIKVPWELSRFQQVFAWIWTDPGHYREAFLRQWADWLEANLLARGVNWACAMDVALRAISWTAALAAWGADLDAATLDRMGSALADHGHFIRDNLEWVVGDRTNHYFSDIVGLAVIGAVLRPHPPAEDWSAFAARELEREILRQFAADGFDRECSSTYHRLMLELALLGVQASRVAGFEPAPAVRQRLIAACRALQAISCESGRGPLIGDNDSGRVFEVGPRDDDQMRWILPVGAAILGEPALAVGGPPPELALLCGPRAIAEGQPAVPAPGDCIGGTQAPHNADRMPVPHGHHGPAAGQALPDSGLFVLGSGDDRLIVRCGPLGYTAVGSHEHLDQLSFSLFVGGMPVLVDPGQHCYTPWPRLRDAFRVTAAHNSVTVDDEPECRMFTMGRMAFSVINESRPRLLGWEATPEGARFAGRHHGFRRLPGGGDFDRQISYRAAERRWAIADRLGLFGRHRFAWRFHLHPEVAPRLDASGCRLELSGGKAVMLTWTFAQPPEAALEEGMYAPAYGVQVVAPILVLRLDCQGPVEAVLALSTEEEQP